jgi:membrane protease YdiL (CAAX protease family)
MIWGIAIFIGRGENRDLLLTTPGIELMVMVLGTCGPAIGAIFSILTIEGKGSLKTFFKQFFSVRFGRKVWLAIFLVSGISSIIAWIIPEFWENDRISTYLPSIFVFPVYILMMIFLGGGQEEIGWRGYILPYLERRFGLIIGSLILGIVWAVWHIPLWFLPGSTQVYMNFFGFTLMCIGYSYFFSWVIKETGNRLFSGLVVHGVANAFDALFPWLIMIENVKQPRFWIYSLIIFGVGVFIVFKRTYKNLK